jgi:hypothetical protein
LAEAWISEILLLLLRRSFDGGWFFLLLGNDRTFNVVLEPIGHLFCAVVKKRLCSGDLSGKSGPDPDLLGGQISPIG